MIKQYAEEQETTLFGHPNDPLPNMKEMTEKEFAQSMFFTYTPDYHFYRQINRVEKLPLGLAPGPKGGGLHVHCYVFFDKTGIAFASDYWAGKVRYFHFAVCEHEFTEKNIGRCLHKYTCVKCGFNKEVDSSD